MLSNSKSFRPMSRVLEHRFSAQRGHSLSVITSPLCSESPLQKGSADCVRRLLQARADVNAVQCLVESRSGVKFHRNVKRILLFFSISSAF